MFSTLFHNIVYTPLYNALIFLVGVVPGADVGIAVILLTILVKLLLFPMAHNMSRTQVLVKKMQPELEEIKIKYKDDKQLQTTKVFDLYKKNKINPFSGILVLFIQLPIVLGLYWVFAKGGLPAIDLSIVYPFINNKVLPNMNFVGIVDMAGKSVVLALLAGITQFVNMAIIIPKAPEVVKGNKQLNIKDDIARSMHVQMKYVMPIIITFVAYTISAAVALYWVTSNIFTILQEIFVRKQLKLDNSYEK